MSPVGGSPHPPFLHTLPLLRLQQQEMIEQREWYVMQEEYLEVAAAKGEMSLPFLPLKTVV